MTTTATELRERWFGRARVILSDPPWRFETRSDAGRGRCPSYECIHPRDIVKLPIHKLAAPSSILFLWTSAPYLKFALAHMEENDFTYQTVAFTWAKTTTMGKWAFGGGYWTRANPEMVLLGTRGRGVKAASRSVRELIVSERREHSRKPDEVYLGIRDLLGPWMDDGAIELFARPPGWQGWAATGLEADGIDIRELLEVA